MIYGKTFWKATAVRLIRTFLTTILGTWTAGQIITEIDWKTTLLAAFSATVYIFVLCLIQGLPEVKMKEETLENKPELPDEYYEPEMKEESNDE